MINDAYYAEELMRLSQDDCQDEEKKAVSRRSALAWIMLLLTRGKLLWLQRLDAASKFFLISRILQI